jgi:hypothetical protein
MCIKLRPALAALALLGLSACPGSVISKYPTVAVEDVLCLIQQYSTQVQAGTTPAQAIINAASQCNLAVDIATQVLGAHIAGEEREARPMTDAGTFVDAGAPIFVKKAVQ